MVIDLPGGQINDFLQKGGKIEIVARPGELWKHLVGYRGFRSCVTKDSLLYYYVVVGKLEKCICGFGTHSTSRYSLPAEER